ncbi:hypothetical protein [Oleiharenicola lentus]|uniref:hypothetical protein n=1 Tax=Oleiharenicola lentus TaxID=2508720 RepID=UPI003F66EBC9
MRALSNQTGSALSAVIVITVVLGVLSASILKYSMSERRSNERQRLTLRARNMSENVAIYGSEQITNKLYRLRSFSSRKFSGMNALKLPPSRVLTTAFSSASGVEVNAGITKTSELTLVPFTDQSNPNAGLQVSTSTVPIIAKSTMTHPAVGSVNSYSEQDLEVTILPLFQYAIFYNMDLEFGPGPNMTISGPVHTNGNFISRIQTGFSNTIRFTERVTAAGGFFANTAYRGPTYMADGSVDNGPGGSGPLYFRKPTESVDAGTEIKSGSGIWRDHFYTASSGNATATPNATGLSQFKNFATSTYLGNLRTSLHGVTKLVLPAIGDYDESTATGRQNGRQIIDPPSATDVSAVYGTKFSRNAGLYIIANPDATTRTGFLPNGNAVSMRARSYRAWLNTTASDGSHTLTEVVLPGQPSYGPNNDTVNRLPNAYRVDTAIGSNQLLRIPQGASADLPDTGYPTPATVPAFSTTSADSAEAYFYDIRRSFNNTGAPYNRTSTNRFRPRPVAKIDLDLTRLKLAVERTLFNFTSSSAIYHLGIPNDDNWSKNILNAAATPESVGLGLSTGKNTNYLDFPDTFSPAAIIKGYNGARTPSSIGFSVVTETPGLGLLNLLLTPYVLEETTAVQADNGTYATWSLVSNATASSYTHNISANATALRFTQMASGGVSLDQQIIPVASALTTNDVVTSLTDDCYIIPTNALGFAAPAISATSPITTDMRIFVDGVDDTANWNFSVVSVNTMSITTNNITALGLVTVSAAVSTPITLSRVTGSFGTGQFKNRYSITAIDPALLALLTTLLPADIVVTLRASKPNSGYPDHTRTFTIKKQNLVADLLTLLGKSVSVKVAGGPGPDPFKIYLADTGNPALLGNFVSGSACPWFDGVTVYIHSTGAEMLTATGTNNSAVRDRVDSGLRLWNGRGSIVSLPVASYPGRTGFSLATNDAAYIVGHFNADGNINATLTATGTGGYSGRYPESSSEMLTSIMADAITILSEPEFTRSGSSPSYRYYQSSGWSDSMSRNRRDDSANYSSSWQSSNPANSNTQDGIDNSLRPALMPNRSASFISGENRTGPMPLSTSSSNWPDARTSKFAPSETEISACLLTGIVPTPIASAPSNYGGAQTSGGAHNFPRLSENWAGSVALYIRGSLVAMFESQVATEPWGIRWYQGAIRNWGLHENLRNANHDVPLEPIVLGARRMSYRSLTASEYEQIKTTINALSEN